MQIISKKNYCASFQNILVMFLKVAAIIPLTRAALESAATFRWLGRGRGVLRPPPSRLTPEIIGGRRSTRRRSTALKEGIPTQPYNFLKRSNVGSRSGQISKLTLFALSAVGTRPKTSTSPDSAKVLYLMKR